MVKKIKRNKNKWFIPVRGSYLPNNWKGWLTYVPFCAYLFFALWAGWHFTQTAANAVLFILPNWVAAAGIMTWIARRTS